MNMQRDYAHEVVTDVMHNQVPNLVTAQRAREQAERLREINADLLNLAVDIVALRAEELNPIEYYRRMDEIADRAHDLLAKARGTD